MFFASPREAIAFFYVLFDFFCAAIIGILLYTTLTDVERTNKRLHLVSVLSAVIFYCIIDSIWMMAYSNFGIPCTTFTRYLTNVLLYSAITLTVYTICRFFFSVWEAVAVKKIAKSKFAFIPFILILLVILTTPFHKLFFSISGNGVLVKHALYFPLMFILYGYVIVFGIISLVFYFQTQNDFAKEQYQLVAIYMIPVTVSGLVRYQVWTVPSFTIGLTIATLIIYIFQMRDLISLDALTGINNRRQGERFFIEQIRRINEEPHSTIECLYLFMMDLNKFKSINDTYGHTEGDKALIAAAEVLKEACSHIRRKCIMSRFGGDEFVIGVVFTPEEAHLLYEKIQLLIKKKNEELHAPYKISISIGFTYYKKEYKDFRTFLSNADELMYEMKEIAHREAEMEEKSTSQPSPETT